MDNDHYIRMYMNILHNRDWYRVIPATYEMVDLAYLNNVIAKHILEFIRTTFPVTPTFYALPKVHKNKSNPSGKPIISGNGCLMENTSWYLTNI